ncbi:M15 family metallopeptidase [Actinacidiphila sp. SB3-2]
MAYRRSLAACGAALAGVGLAASLAAPAPAAPAGPHSPASASAARPGQEPRAPREFVALDRVAPGILQEIRYFTPHNFTGVPVDGYREPTCLLTRPAAKALKRVQHRMLRSGYTLKVYDCYRPQRAVDHFVRWAKDLEDQRMKGEFYPEVDKTRLFADGYIAEKSGHSRGSTMDLTMVKLPAKPTRPYVPGEKLTKCYAPKAERFPDNSLDMGTGFDCFDTRSHTADPRTTPEQKANRLRLKSAMEREGFTNLPEEWWHFTYKKEPFPDRYFDFPVTHRSVRH